MDRCENENAGTRDVRWADIKTDMDQRAAANDAKWRDGRTAVYVFNAGEEIGGDSERSLFGLHVREWPRTLSLSHRLAQMEKDVISMGLGYRSAMDQMAAPGR